MRVETVGDGPTEVAVVGAIHGDEPCGARAIERFLESDLRERVERPAKLIVANERALAAGERYVDVDLNRVFPGDPDADAHERRLASRIVEEVSGHVTMGIHSTMSYDEPFGTVARPTEEKARILRGLPIAHVVDFTGMEDGYSAMLPRFVDVEAGHQGTERAAENAYTCLVAFFRATGVLPGTPDPTDTALYRVIDAVQKRPGTAYRVLAENFRRVPAGDPYAETDDGEQLRSDRPFWPVLFSATGHERLLGYRATHEGEVAAVAGDRDHPAEDGDPPKPNGERDANADP